ncbi:MAG TPA: Na+/H+ antiporter NhaA [Polyangiaceae bacterium]|nr:Na+/H+ antiporter NhaA [Polyangiaceae bacterium]
MSSDTARARLFGVVVRPLQTFLQLEAASGIVLLLCAMAALVWANISPASYHATFEYPLTLGVGGALETFTLQALINDGLMAIFFFVVGMEIKRELVSGELNSFAKASLPALAALGGMILPAGIFLAFTWGTAGQRGWGIPMATDIAFCIGILTLLKDRVPRALVVFVTALAIFDDIGGILVIALFYGHGLSALWLVSAAGLTCVLFWMSRAYVINGLAYAAVGAGLWYTLHHGGVHATIAGVVVGLMIPARPQRPSREVLRELAGHVSDLDRKPPDEALDGAEILAIEEKLEDLQAPVYRFVHLLHPFVAFFIMPVFALANSGVVLGGAGLATLTAPVTLGTAFGLFVGKQIGIYGFTAFAIKLGAAQMPRGASRAKLFGVSVVAGVGFTVALFIAALAYHDAPNLLEQAKVGILLGSAAAGVAGFMLLRFVEGSKATSTLPSRAPRAADDAYGS